MTKWSGVTPNTAPALGDYLMGVTSGNVDFRVTLQNLVNVIMKASLLNNPSKFYLGRSAAYTPPTTYGPLLFDTKIYDTGNNCDVVTNKGRFTAPVSGFYSFKGAALVAAISGDHFYGGVSKNGAEYARFFEQTAASSTNMTYGMACELQLTAGDYVEFGWSSPTGRSTLTSPVGAYIWFTGHLISAT